MYSILSTGTGIFGTQPWGEIRFPGDEVLPQKFTSDPEAVLAYVSSKDFYRYNTRSNGTFLVPWTLSDNKKVMMAICTKNAKALVLASPRLQNDEHVVRAALLRDNAYDAQWCVLRHASDRLREDKKLVLDLLESSITCREDDYYTIDFGWLQFAKLDIAEQKEVAYTIFRHVSDKTNVRFLNFSAPLCDDKDLMLQFIALDWTSLGWCSDRLRSDIEVVEAAASQKVDAWHYAFGAIRQEHIDRKTESSVLEEIANGSFYRHDIPEDMKSNRTVIMAALEAGMIRDFSDLPASMRHDKSVLLAFIKANDDRLDEELYCDLPDHLQKDEEIAMALLKAKYCWYEDIFEKLPSLYRNREAMMAIHDRFPAEFVRECPFRDDKEFILAAYENNGGNLRYASDRLLSDRDFMDAASDLFRCSFITFAPPEFQVSNLDLVVKSIEKCGKFDSMRED